MKLLRILLVFIMLFAVGVKARSQFVLTPFGLMDSLDNNKNFTVLEFSDLTQKQISDKVNYYLSTIYLSPKDAISKNDSSLITAITFCEDCIKAGLYIFDMRYSITFRFKPGKLRIDSPDIKFSEIKDSPITLRLELVSNMLGIYDKKSNLKMPKVKNQIEAYFNVYIKKLVDSVMANNEKDNW